MCTMVYLIMRTARQKRSEFILKSVKHYYKILIPQQLNLHNMESKKSISF